MKVGGRAEAAWAACLLCWRVGWLDVAWGLACVLGWWLAGWLAVWLFGWLVVGWLEGVFSSHTPFSEFVPCPTSMSHTQPASPL